jgi:small subunit ribosomal protein S2
MVTLEQMLLSNVHLGHAVKQWNPKMNQYIFCQRKGVHIIDLLQTLVCLEKCCKFLRNASTNNKSLVILNLICYVIK